ncbi:MAG TPA: FkbM family methyltransferase, partial [Solirubrobacteraceae bacterium]|nr:FkbM family methyltransferase [Solirubrobacteraceae bacterium]
LARRAIRSSPTAQAIVGSPLLRRAIGAQRAARALRPAARFLVCELRVGAVGGYAIAGSALKVHLRHGSRDVEIFNEIFAAGRESYEPPAEVAAVLGSLGPLSIGDLGANIGLFGIFALQRWPVASMRSFEPDPANAALLRATIAANDAAARWELVAVAVSNADATATFEAGMLSESRLAADGCTDAAMIEVPVVDLFAQLPVDLLKIDIEGAEWAILGDARLACHPARAIVLEWHQRMCPALDPRRTARELLEAAGYEAIDVDGEEARAEARVNGLMWGLRR